LESHFAIHFAGETGLEWKEAASQRWFRSPGRVLLHEAAFIAALRASGGRISNCTEEKKWRSRMMKKI
jgi:hypothetical protein